MPTLLSRLLATVALVVAASARAEAPNADCSIRVVHARSTGEGMDPRITRLRALLQKPPFTEWKRFDLLSQQELTLKLGTPMTTALPNGKRASLTYVHHDKSEHGPHRLELRIQIGEGAKQLLDTSLVIDAGGVAIQAGQKHQDGMLILGFTCDVHHDHL